MEIRIDERLVDIFKEASNKLLDFISDDLDKSDALEQALALLSRAFLANANK